MTAVLTFRMSERPRLHPGLSQIIYQQTVVMNIPYYGNTDDLLTPSTKPTNLL